MKPQVPAARRFEYLNVRDDSVRRFALVVAALGGLAPWLTAQAPPSGASGGAYLDSGAAALVRRARARKAGEDRSLLGYRAMATQRIGVGIRALSRDRILYHHEVAARIEWRRGGTTRIEALGARQGIPIASGRATVPEDLSDLIGDLAFDPDEDLLRITTGKSDSAGDDDLRHPLAEGSEAHYRFASGDTTVLHFPDGRSLTVVELVVIPRRAEFWLVSGSFWFDAASYGLVRAVFRTARPFDLELDEPGDASDVPAPFRPVRAEIRYVTIEYGLHDFRWWLPRIVALEGVGTAGSLMSIPIRFERLYTEYQVDGGNGLPSARPIVVPQRAAGERPARRERVRVRAEVEIKDRDRDSIGTVVDSVAGQRIVTYSHRSRDTKEPRTVEIVYPLDSMALAESPLLPPGFYDPGQQLLSEADAREIGRAVGLLPGLPGLSRSALRWAPNDPTLLRYNRVEGLSFGARFDAESGPLALDASARLGWADLAPKAEVGLTRTTTGSRHRLAGYSRLSSVDAAARPFGVGNSLGAALFGRDDGDYFRAHGLELTGAPAPARPQWYAWRLFAEAQRAADKGTDASLRRLWDSGHRFRPMVSAASAEQLGASLDLRLRHGINPERLILAVDAHVEGSLGDYEFAKGFLTTRAAFPLPLGLATALEAAAGSSAGSVPPQSLWYLGGPATLRGYAGAAAVGESFWRARADVSTRFTGARVALFGDAAWAGPRADLGTGSPLLSWGIGASFLDGLVRLDAARGVRWPAGWRVDLYWDGAL